MSTFNQFWSKHFFDLRIHAFDKRNITVDDIVSVVDRPDINMQHEQIGESFEGRPIMKLTWGQGPKNVIAWAAMHGNETTSLRGWMDLFANHHHKAVQSYFEPLLAEFTIHFIPLLNPDGAARYTRRNAMSIDMNRDAQAVQSPEMKCLMQQIVTIKPVLAFNLHDQRNIFSDGRLPATISFLAPSVDVERTVNQGRKRTMDLIGAATKQIRPVMSGGVGRYTDEFYPTAIGERVQKMGIPTVLVECGSAKNDPLRQEGRMLNGIILHSILSRMMQGTQAEINTYLHIPVNKANQADVIIRGVAFKKDGQEFKADVSILEELKLVDGDLVSLNRVLDVGDLSYQLGLEEYHFIDEQPFMIQSPGSFANFSITTDKGSLVYNEGVRVRA